MIRLLAVLWLAAVMLAGGYLVWRVHKGLVFRTDLMSLLPRENQNPARQQAIDTVNRAISQQLVLLVGHADRARARSVAVDLSRRLSASGLAEVVTTGFDTDRLRQMVEVYFPYRRGLLAAEDRHRLLDGKTDEIALAALSQVYGVLGLADARLLRADPFLLTQRFLITLPLPPSRLALDDGMLSRQADGRTWILVAARLTGDPYALDTQRSLAAALDIDGLVRRHPGTEVLRLGAVFFAQAAAEEALSETSFISILSTLGTVMLVLAVYRAIWPLLLSVLVIAVGVMVALAATLWAFGDLHVGAMLFGVSLIGVAVDYSLQYCTEIFATAAPPSARLRRVLVGVSLGTLTTVIGYVTLFLAPFPGLRQIAAFSAVGLVAAWLTVVLWLPRLDRSEQPRHGVRMLAWAGAFLRFWEAPRWTRLRLGVLGLAAIVTAGGLFRVHADDEVRRMQSLSPLLIAEQERVQRLIGSTAANQFFLVQAADDEVALEDEEALVDRLWPLVAAGTLAGFQAPAQFVPSVARQAANRRLVVERLDPLRTRQLEMLHLADASPSPDHPESPLRLGEVIKVDGPFAFLSSLVLGPGIHVVTLNGVARLDEVAAAARGLTDVRFIDPAADYTFLLGKYRVRAMLLLALSALLMLPPLAWRYGSMGALLIMLPPALAVVLAPAARALAGSAFTFFDAMALVLVLSIGVDYAVFCAESAGERKPVTMLAVALAACTALLSFGLLALSRVLAVHAFGTTMLIGILLAFLFAPMARGRPRA